MTGFAKEITKIEFSSHPSASRIPLHSDQILELVSTFFRKAGLRNTINNTRIALVKAGSAPVTVQVREYIAPTI